MPAKILTPILITIVLGIVAAFAAVAQTPWLAPSLASAVFTQGLTPDQPSAKPYSIAAGQFIGGASGFVGVLVGGAAAAPQFFGDHQLVAARVVAVAVAVLVSAAVQLATKAISPAGGSTALVVAVGMETANWAGANRLAVGIVLATVLGEIARQIILRAQKS